MTCGKFWGGQRQRQTIISVCILLLGRSVPRQGKEGGVVYLHVNGSPDFLAPTREEKRRSLTSKDGFAEAGLCVLACVDLGWNGGCFFL